MVNSGPYTLKRTQKKGMYGASGDDRSRVVPMARSVDEVKVRHTLSRLNRRAEVVNSQEIYLKH